ncbi:4-coumarate--CoA ligase 1-like [Bradysia coprophila]|uniref:4-coumarate--CoA ligase 1-like n=1 Tax=Bradysia coprophila TaxID=38358 RepID=UPI00187D9937|nr:4-coumarate--CoA ligase 1-like [Bradysia coprophila]XP_037041230.1 4-coumarate--CoA ligase 1-like [Bradysia coprophila]
MSYDRNTKILSGIEVPPLYHPNITLGEFLLHYLYRDSTRVIQTNHDDGVQITAGEMAKLGCQIAGGLLNHIKIGDVLGIVCKNTSYVTPLVLGGFLAGTPVSTVDPTYRAKEIAHVFSLTKPKIVFCDKANLSEVKEGLRQCEVVCKVLTVDERAAEHSHLFDLFESSDANAEFRPTRLDVEASKNCAAILCSSGTTGLSKGCMLSHQQCMSSTKAGPYFSTLFSFSSLYWYTGFSGLMQSLANNINRVITKSSFSPELLVDIIEKHKVNSIVSPPAHIQLLLKSKVIEKADFSSLRIAVLTGGPMDASLRKQFQKFLKAGSIASFYATTEIGSVISSTAPFEPISNSCGKPTPNTKVKVVDDDGKLLDALQVGEICVLHPYTFLGYCNNREETETAADSTGWLKTGDLGYVTEGGEIFLVDRKKEVFDQMNYTVYPSEIESYIRSIKGVKEVCVVGIRELAGWRGAAVVVKDADSSVTEKDIVDEVHRNFLDFKRLHGGAYFVDSLPTTTTGKIKRLEARTIAEKMYEQKFRSSSKID